MGVTNLLRKNQLSKKLLNSRLYFFIRERKKIHAVYNRMGFHGKPGKKLIADMLDERRLHCVPYDEYFLFGFQNLTNEERRKFVSDIERIKFANQLNDAKNDPIYYDKSITYQYYKDFYHRDVISASAFNAEEFAVFSEFVEKHTSFICKPVDGGCGVGIHIFDMGNRSAEEMFSTLRKQYPGHIVIEELIVQQSTMHQLNPSSVNTVRMPTIRFNDRVEVFYPVLRVGRKGSVTDNAGSGGVVCAVDVQTGTVYAAADEFGNIYETHPDSGVNLIGFTVPRWEEAKAMVKELAMIVPNNRYSSWDMALTNDGWVMIEVNAKGQFLWQYATKQGFREEIESVLKEIKTQEA